MLSERQHHSAHSAAAQVDDGSPGEFAVNRVHLSSKKAVQPNTQGNIALEIGSLCSLFKKFTSNRGGHGLPRPLGGIGRLMPPQRGEGARAREGVAALTA